MEAVSIFNLCAYSQILLNMRTRNIKVMMSFLGKQYLAAFGNLATLVQPHVANLA